MPFRCLLQSKRAERKRRRSHAGATGVQPDGMRLGQCTYHGGLQGYPASKYAADYPVVSLDVHDTLVRDVPNASGSKHTLLPSACAGREEAMPSQEGNIMNIHTAFAMPDRGNSGTRCRRTGQ